MVQGLFPATLSCLNQTPLTSKLCCTAFIFHLCANASEHCCSYLFFQKASSLAVWIFMEYSCTKYVVCSSVNTEKILCELTCYLSKMKAPSAYLPIPLSSCFFSLTPQQLPFDLFPLCETYLPSLMHYHYHYLSFLMLSFVWTRGFFHTQKSL